MLQYIYIPKTIPGKHKPVEHLKFPKKNAFEKIVNLAIELRELETILIFFNLNKCLKRIYIRE